MDVVVDRTCLAAVHCDLHITGWNRLGFYVNEDRHGPRLAEYERCLMKQKSEGLQNEVVDSSDVQYIVC